MNFRHLATLVFTIMVALTGVRAAEAPPLILVSLDGFRWDYTALHPAETPHLRRLIREGVTARALIPVFPTNTFPNHYSVVTGLYPSRHGIVNNDFFDSTLGGFFRYNTSVSAHDKRWWGGEPIWITAVKQGRQSACYFWPGSETEIDGVRPTFWKPYAYDKVTFEQRLDEVAGWLRLPPDQRPAVITFYIEEINSVGHRHGPDSPELAEALRVADARVGALSARLRTAGIAANLVFTSDHGMTSCSSDRVAFLDDYLDLATVQIDFSDTCVGLRPLAGTDVPSLLRALAKIPPAQAKAYRAEDLPARLHVDATSPRVPPVWILPAEGWHVMRRSIYNKARAKFLNGQHGYDPAFPSMHGLFVAHGPSFKTGAVIDPVENIHIYNLLCAALQLTPAPNDGDDRLVKSVLR